MASGSINARPKPPQQPRALIGEIEGPRQQGRVAQGEQEKEEEWEEEKEEEAPSLPAPGPGKAPARRDEPAAAACPDPCGGTHGAEGGYNPLIPPGSGTQGAIGGVRFQPTSRHPCNRR